MTEIKICGLKRPDDIDLVNRCLPEMAGFVFYPPSSRYVTFEEATILRKDLDGRIKSVGVFVDSDPKTIVEAMDSGIISMIQLHGDEDDRFIEELRKGTDAPIIQAYVIRTEEDIREANRSEADYVLLDNGKGTGKTFDWSLIGDMDRDYFLSGGLSLENIGEAIERLEPFAVDVSSGVETNGMKDADKVCAFIEKVRRMNGSVL